MSFVSLNEETCFVTCLQKSSRTLSLRMRVLSGSDCHQDTTTNTSTGPWPFGTWSCTLGPTAQAPGPLALRPWDVGLCPRDKVDQGPTVRDRKGACGNVSDGGKTRPPHRPKGCGWNPPPKAARAAFLPDRPSGNSGCLSLKASS